MENNIDVAPVKKKSSPLWKLKIESFGEAEEAISGAAWLFVVIGIIFFPLSFLLPDVWIDGIIYITAGSLLGYKKNIWVASVVVFLAAISIFSTALSALTGYPGGRNVWLAIIVFYASVKSLVAVIYLRKHSLSSAEMLPEFSKSQKLGSKIFPKLFWISLTAFVIVAGLIIVGLSN